MQNDFENSIGGLSMRDRISVMLRVATIIVGVTLVTSGKPPMAGQTLRQMPVDPTPAVQAVEDAYQDRDIRNLQERTMDNREAIAKNLLVITEQGKQITDLTSRVNTYGMIISILLTGSVASQVWKKKKSPESEDS